MTILRTPGTPTDFGAVFAKWPLTTLKKRQPMQPKILLVDDNEDLLLVTQIILKGQGYDTFLARSAAEADRKIRVHNPSLILLDIGLGDENGSDFCRRLRHDPATRDLRVILMSGDDSWSACRDAADDFLPKPFDFNELIDKVHSQLLGEPQARYTE
jgi:DNA-binding response OmpR family regulator